MQMTQSNNIETLLFYNKPIRYVRKFDGLYFVAKDITIACLQSWNSNKFVRNNEYKLLSVDTIRGNRNIIFVSFLDSMKYIMTFKNQMGLELITELSKLLNISFISNNTITNVKDIKKEYLFPDTKVITVMLVRKGILKRKNKTYCTVEESARGYNWLCYTESDFIFKGFFRTPELHNIILALKEEYTNQPLLTVNTSTL